MPMSGAAGAMRRLFLDPPAGRGEPKPPAAVLCPRPRRIHPCSADLLLSPPCFLLDSDNNNNKKEQEEMDGDEEGNWAVFGGSPPARANNPLARDPNFLKQRHPLPDSPPNLPILLHHHDYSRPQCISRSGTNFGPSLAPAVRVQGFHVACRSSHDAGGRRVLSARA